MNDLSNDPTNSIDPAAAPFEFTDEQFRDAAHSYDFARNGAINRGIDSDPDQAAHAVRLADSTGIPAALINDTYPEFVDDHKKLAAQAVVARNPDLDAYVMHHPLAAAVSADDWANLDAFTRQTRETSDWLGGLHKILAKPFQPLADMVAGALTGGVAGIEGGIQHGAEMTDATSAAMDPAQNAGGRLGAAATGALWSATDAASRVFATVAGGVMGAGSGALQGAGLEEAESNRAVEALMNLSMAGGGAHGESVKPRPVSEVIRPWQETHEEPPTGLHPEIDAAKAQINAEGVERLELALEKATATQTAERSPEMLKSAMNGAFEDQSIGIHSDAVLALYGDKLPTPDDGILGWVPGIAEQLEAAREIGSDVTVPVADWIANGREVHQALRDDIRMWPGGVTAREAGELPKDPRETIGEPLPQIRASAGLEPKFSMGDRKLTLTPKMSVGGDDYATQQRRMSRLFDDDAGKDAEPGKRLEAGKVNLSLQDKYEGVFAGSEEHDYDINDEKGVQVGTLRLTPNPETKALYVNWIGGKAGLWANSFGPALIRDLKQQIKTLYPEYETISGFRVSGARKVAGASADKSAPVVRLDSDDAGDFARMQQLLTHAGWNKISEGVHVRPLGDETLDQAHIGQVAEREIARITGGSVDTTLATGIYSENAGQMARGSYLPSADKRPEIVLNLVAPDVVGVARHEAVHQLRQYGFLTDDEWSTLSNAAQSEGWLDRYGIYDRYAHLDDEGRIEEAIADGFKEWAAQAPEVRLKTGIGAVFQKIMDLFDRIKTALGFGAEATWEDVFAKIHSGEVGKRGPGAPMDGAFDMRAKMSLEDETRAITEGISNLQAASIGLSKDSHARLMDAIRKQAEEDLKIAEARAVKEQTKRQSAEWKSNHAAMVKEVSADLHQRPDIAADLFLGSGELYGKKLRQRYTLGTDELMPEERVGIPDHYFAKSGLPVDTIAGMFGYGSRAEFLDGLRTLEAAKNVDGRRLPPMEFMRKMIRAEADRRMEQRYGNLQANIMADAKDQALSDSAVNVQYEELVATAMKAGMELPPEFNKETLLATAKRLVDNQTVGRISSYKVMQEMGRLSRSADAALLAEDYATAAVLMQKRTVAGMVGKEALKIEKEIKKFDGMAAKLAKRDQKAMMPEYTNWVHDLLNRIGKPIRRDEFDLAHEQSKWRSGNTLEDFVARKMDDGVELAVGDDLLDPNWKKGYKDLTVPEFRMVRDAIKSLRDMGRDELSMFKDGERVDFEEGKAQLLSSIMELPTKDDAKDGSIRRAARSTGANLLQPESVVDRFDRLDWRGPWNQLFYRMLKEGDNTEASRIKDVAKDVREILNRKLPKGDVKNPGLLLNPRTGEPLVLDREALWAVMLNAGNESNLAKFAEGWSVPKLNHKVTPEAVMNWIHSVATKDDWDGVQAIWDTLSKTGTWSADMYRGMFRMPMKWIEPRAVDTPFGQYAGGYYPVIAHPEFPGKSATLTGISEKGLFGDGYSSGFMPGAGYTITRKDYAGPMALDLNALPSRIAQQVHDASMRPGLIQAAKILRDPDIRDAIISRSGRETYDMMKSWLRTVANSSAQDARMDLFDKWTGGVLNYVRRNVISNLVGLNLGTVEKHGMSAFALSVKEVGPVNFANALKDLFRTNAETNQRHYDFIRELSPEIQRRDRNWRESMYGATEQFGGRGKFWEFRNMIQQLGSKPVALSDLASSVPMTLAAYRKAISEGMPEADALYYAEKMLRKAHGSTAVTSQPMIMNKVSPWFTGMYNFYNDVLNRAVESYWRAGMAKKAFKEGDYAEFKKNAALAASGTFVSLIWPAIVHNMVDPPHEQKDDGVAITALRHLVHPYAGLFPIVRDFAAYMIGNDSPDVGLFTSASKQLGQFVKDFEKKEPFSPAHTEKLLRDGGSFLGIVLGGPGQQLGRWAGGLYGLGSGQERVQGPVSAHALTRFGTTKGHARTLDEWRRGEYDRRK